LDACCSDRMSGSELLLSRYVSDGVSPKAKFDTVRSEYQWKDSAFQAGDAIGWMRRTVAALTASESVLTTPVFEVTLRMPLSTLYFIDCDNVASRHSSECRRESRPVSLHGKRIKKTLKGGGHERS
jgi:hypothetical protein